jgi:hypothetical protein
VITGDAGVPLPALRRRFCDRMANQVRTMLLTRLAGRLR